MHCSVRAIFLAIFAMLAALPSTHAEYWKAPLPPLASGNSITCGDGFTCARTAQIAWYGSNLDFGSCYYLRKSNGGYLSTATCAGWTSGSAHFSRFGYAELYCETGEVKSTNGCIKAPVSAATGEWGAETYAYDAAGNRLSHERTLSGASSQMTYAYGPLSSRLNEIATNGTLSRSLAHDASGNIISDVRGANIYSYTYDASNRLSEVMKDGVLWASYFYNGFSQLASRTLTAASGTPGTIHYLYDLDGRLIAEADALTGQTLREYLWLDDLPVAVIDGSTLYHVVTDHLYRPIAMHDASGAEIWSAVWEPFGALHSVSGSINLDARFPGQWYQLETGLHYNWHRHYDPSLGRYTQPDPIGMPDGPNRFAYALANPVMYVDENGEFVLPMIAGGLAGAGIDAAMQYITTGCIDWWQVAGAGAMGAVGGGMFSNAFKHSSKAMSWFNSAQKYNAVSKRVRRVRGLTGDQELHHWLFPNGGWGSRIPNGIRNHPGNLHTMDTAMHMKLHGGKLGLRGTLNHGIPGWFASTMGFAGGNLGGNALKPDCTCDN